MGAGCALRCAGCERWKGSGWAKGCRVWSAGLISSAWSLPVCNVNMIMLLPIVPSSRFLDFANSPSQWEALWMPYFGDFLIIPYWYELWCIQISRWRIFRRVIVSFFCARNALSVIYFVWKKFLDYSLCNFGIASCYGYLTNFAIFVFGTSIAMAGVLTLTALLTLFLTMSTTHNINETIFQVWRNQLFHFAWLISILGRKEIQ